MLNMSRGSNEDIAIPARLAIIFYLEHADEADFKKCETICEELHNFSLYESW
jgi:hypothetical protein